MNSRLLCYFFPNFPHALDARSSGSVNGHSQDRKLTCSNFEAIDCFPTIDIHCRQEIDAQRVMQSCERANHAAEALTCGGLTAEVPHPRRRDAVLDAR